MPAVPANGIELDYQTFGPEDGPALLLIHGLGAQMTDWPSMAIDGLIGAGFHVIAFDNRDQGRSTWFDEAGAPDIGALLVDSDVDVPYLLSDMAADAAALLEALAIPSAHVLGVSMGGMIAQQLTIDHPHVVTTLTSIMSTPSPTVGPPTPEATAALLVPAVDERSAAIEQSVATSRIIASPGFPFDEAGLRSRAEVHFDRGHHPVGTGRQLAAILASPDRRPGLAEVTVPTLVVHGDSDPLVTLPGGLATAEAVPGAELWVIKGMGHDLPAQVIPELCTRQAALAAVAS